MGDEETGKNDTKEETIDIIEANKSPKVWGVKINKILMLIERKYQ